jgi:hypothetical protein
MYPHILKIKRVFNNIIFFLLFITRFIFRKKMYPHVLKIKRVFNNINFFLLFITCFIFRTCGYIFSKNNLCYSKLHNFLRIFYDFVEITRSIYIFIEDIRIN